ncbi:hypothetical protein DL764_007104 [Monosporascus ibericus]|uniref:Beta-glucuronidase C-terminal domain-containing protein n=1 Tax=Monosporascus ibericus TaxID=155417 RepID=A0A4Q4T687_9PEZI|nr:hypothetical protein DL764_007104 [Monosporascus ibericus]
MLTNPSHLGLALLGLASQTLTAYVPRSYDVSVSIQVPTETPADASSNVDPDFPGFAFEEASFVRYAEDDDGKPNAFSINLIKEVTSRTGGKPIIRLGGTSPDYGRYYPGQEEPALPVAEQDNYQNIGFTTIGPRYWDLAQNFADATYMIQVPLATTNVSEAVAWTQAAVGRIGLAKIHSIQPGNEPDLYRDDFRGVNGVFLGPPDYQGTLSNESYVGNYTKYVDEIIKNVDVPEKSFFTAFDVASHVENHAVAAWLLDLDTCFGLGIDKRGALKEVSHHYYQNHAGTAENLAAGLMTLSLTHSNMDAMRVRINWLRENRPDLPFIINEVGNSLMVTNSYEYQNRLGSALWQVDFYLYSMAMGVARINYQQIMHAGYSLWLPVASAGHPAQVFPNFYSQPFVADFIGSSGETRVAKLDIADGGASQPNLAAYAAFEAGAPRRIAVANLAYWNRTSSDTERPVVHVQLEVPDGLNAVTVYRLASPDGAGADATTITYGGSQWTYESLGHEVKGVRDDTEDISVRDGVATVAVPASEAVLVWL